LSLDLVDQPSSYSERSLVKLSLDLVDQPSSYCAITLLVGSSDP